MNMKPGSERKCVVVARPTPDLKERAKQFGERKAREEQLRREAIQKKRHRENMGLKPTDDVVIGKEGELRHNPFRKLLGREG